MNLTEVPSLHPTTEEFEDPITYLSSPKIMELGVKYGMVKIIPPADFKPPLSINENKFKFIPRLQKLKELSLINRCRLMFMKQLKNYNEMNKINKPKDTFEVLQNIRVHYYDFFIETVKYYQALENITHLPDLSASKIMKDDRLWDYLHGKFTLPVKALKSFYYDKIISYFNYLSAKPEFTSIKEQYPTSILQNSDTEDTDDDDENFGEDNHCLICHKDEYPKDTLLCDSCDKPYHRYCLMPPLSKVPKDNWYCDNCIIGNGYYGFTDSSYQYSLSDFKDFCQDFDADFFKKHQFNGKPTDINHLEEIFWNLVNDTNNTVQVSYGADIRNNKEGEISGFPTIGYKAKDMPKDIYRQYVDHPMNLNNLPFNEKSLLNFLNIDISGMTIPWIYIGSTFSTFCWHVEDQYTLSANYQHLGAVKKWYCIPESNCLKFEKYMKGSAPDLFLKQPDILHQLITLVPPNELVKSGIEVFTANQNPGEYIITYPRVYHAGFNTGFNFNEAVNFTMNEWLKFGVQSTKDYKLDNSTHASVFDIYEMMINILKEYKANPNHENIGPGLAFRCYEYLREYLNQDSKLKETIIENKYITKPVQQYDKPSKHDFQYRANTEKFDDDGISCQKCKGFCTFNYVKHYARPIKEGKNMKKNYLPTPHSSPGHDEKGDAKKENEGRHSKRLKILSDLSNYKLEILCLEDYKKIASPQSDFALRDELFTVCDVEAVDTLLNETLDNLMELRK